MLKKILYRLLRSFVAKKVKVITVIDGDTFVVLDKAGNKFKVRLWGVDAPEIGQKAGKASKEFANNLLNNKWVVLRHKGIDKYGRNVCKVIIDKKDLALLMLRAKQAYVLKHASLSYKIAAFTHPIIFKEKPWSHRNKKRWFFF